MQIKLMKHGKYEEAFELYKKADDCSISMNEKFFLFWTLLKSSYIIKYIIG